MSLAKIFNVTNSSLSFYMKLISIASTTNVLGKLQPKAMLHNQVTEAHGEELTYLSSGCTGFLWICSEKGTEGQEKSSLRPGTLPAYFVL